jgi:hypothetical protein
LVKLIEGGRKKRRSKKDKRRKEKDIFFSFIKKQAEKVCDNFLKNDFNDTHNLDSLGDRKFYVFVVYLYEVWQIINLVAEIYPTLVKDEEYFEMFWELLTLQKGKRNEDEDENRKSKEKFLSFFSSNISVEKFIETTNLPSEICSIIQTYDFIRPNEKGSGNIFFTRLLQ